MITDTYQVTNSEEAKRFNNILRSFWTDNSIEENAETILQFYLRTKNYEFIDTKNNNQIAFFIGFSAKNEELINLLIFSNTLKNKEYSVKDISSFYASQEGLDNILLNITENLKSDNCSFDKSSRKAVNSFYQSCVDYFVANLENEYGDPVKTKNNLFSFIKLTKLKVDDNQHNILIRLLSYDGADVLTELYEKSKKKDQFIEHIKKEFSDKDEVTLENDGLSPKSQHSISSLLLKHQLGKDLKEHKPTKRIKI